MYKKKYLNTPLIYFFIIVLSLFFNYFVYDEAWIYYITDNMYLNGSENDFHNRPLPAGKSYLWSLKPLSVINSFFPQVFFLNRLYSFLSINLSFFLIVLILNKYFSYCRNFFFFSY
jgi:uncharacterized membrane protein SpoIIM required for sporulation